MIMCYTRLGASLGPDAGSCVVDAGSFSETVLRTGVNIVFKQQFQHAHIGHQV